MLKSPIRNKYNKIPGSNLKKENHKNKCIS